MDKGKLMDGDRLLPDWIEGFMAYTEDSEPPLLFRKWTAISTIASALQRKCRVDLGVSLTFYPNFYIILVGPSSTGKGTIMNFSSDLMAEVANIKLTAQSTSLQALIKTQQNANNYDVDEETNETIYHSSVTIFSKEFTVFLGYHNRELIAALCDWYDCDREWTYETVSRGKEKIDGVWVNMLGGTTPDSIQSAFPSEAIGAGLTSRIIFVNEEKREKLVIIPSFSDDMMKIKKHLIHDLENIQMMSGVFRFSKGFIEFYTDWCHINAKNPPFYDKKFDGYLGRRRRHLITLTMVCSASRGSSMTLLRDDVERAAELLQEVEVKMGTVFRGIGKSEISDLINDAIIFFEHETREVIPMWEFARKFEGEMDKITLDRVLTTLETSKYIKVQHKPGADTMIYIFKDRT